MPMHASESTIENIANQNNIRILLVEDHLLTRIGLKTVIARMPEMQVVGEADNGEVAVSKVDELHPDVILMDVGMPVMDGIEAARKIRENHRDVKIIMLTSHDNDRDIFASLAAGAAGYCLKDVEPERLLSAIRSVKAGDVWLDSTIAGQVLKRYGGMGNTQPVQTSIVGQSAQSRPSQSQTSFFTQSRGPATAATGLPQKKSEFAPLTVPLSSRELEVLALVVEGLSNQGIADRLFISLATAKTHVRNILSKLEVDDRTEAAVHALREKLV